MEYSVLASVYDRLAATPKRLEKTWIIHEFLKEVKKEELEDIILLLQGKVFPVWDRKKLGVSSRLVLKAIALATGNSPESIEREWREIGDLGEVALILTRKKTQSTLFQQDLEVGKVLRNVRKLASTDGQGSVDTKIKLIAELLSCARGREAVYIVRTVLEDLRVGIADGTLRDGIAWAMFGDDMGFIYNEGEITVENREQYNAIADTIQSAFDLSNDFGHIASVAREKGLSGVRNISISLGNPIKVMLGPKALSSEDAIKTVGLPAQLEFKYDGFRMQVHKQEDGRIRVFTRRLEDVTDQFPDVIEKVAQLVSGKTFILDAEAVGYNPKTGRYMPFQHISQRIRRKYDIEKMAQEFPVELNVFDIIYYNGSSLIHTPFGKRRELLEQIIIEDPLGIRLAVKKVIAEEEEVDAFFKESLEKGNEGLMVKRLDAPYKPGSRVGYWVKLKPVMETLELVIIGAEWGEGKRARWLSSFTLACVDEDGRFVPLGKVGTGIKEKSEEEVTFHDMTELLTPLIIAEKGKSVTIIPKIVVEVDYEEIQRSPTYGSGYALRFPRVVGIREDRLAEDASTMRQVEELFHSQRK